jgi:type IV secretion system protein VirB9
MTHPLTFPALGLLVSMTTLPALAETAPKPGSHDARVTYATYQEGQVYRINTRLNRLLKKSSLDAV